MRKGGNIAAAQPRPKSLHPAVEAPVRHADDIREPDETTRIVQQMMPDVDAEVPVQKADGSIVIIHTDEARAQATYDVAACAEACFTFDASGCSRRPAYGPRRLCMR
jgi:hypothetical protein